MARPPMKVKREAPAPRRKYRPKPHLADDENVGQAICEICETERGGRGLLLPTAPDAAGNVLLYCSNCGRVKLVGERKKIRADDL